VGLLQAFPAEVNSWGPRSSAVLILCAEACLGDCAAVSTSRNYHLLGVATEPGLGPSLERWGSSGLHLCEAFESARKTAALAAVAEKL
jgi:hypothetical protein